MDERPICEIKFLVLVQETLVKFRQIYGIQVTSSSQQPSSIVNAIE